LFKQSKLRQSLLFGLSKLSNATLMTENDKQIIFE